MIFTAKRALITGAAQGIGFSIAKKLASEGIEVIIADLNEEKALEASDSINKEYGIQCYAVKLNVSDEDDCIKVIRDLVDKCGTIDILINNAGICPPTKKIEEISNEEWLKVFSINVLGMVNCTNALIPYMKDNKFGKIINMASSSGFTGGISVSPTYSVSKAGVMCLTKSMAKQYGSYNINVNALSPGIIKTAMTENLSYDMSVLALRRFGEADEVADLAAFLASDESSYLTGNTVDINGGLYMR